MLKQFEIHIDKSLGFLRGKKLLLAISGGKDSVVLATLLQKLAFDFAFAHCNFQLRGKDSDADESFVREYAAKNSIPVFVKCFNTKTYADSNGISIQMAARDLRYDWFEKIRIENSYDYILTAHHADDVLETFLLNVIRGTGLKGLTGIALKNGFVVRPLLPFARTEIDAYCKEKKISWREDLSNASTKYSRNKLRHQVIPVLKELNPNLLSSFETTLKHLASSEAIVKDVVNTIKNDVKYCLHQDEKTVFVIENWLKLANYKAIFYELIQGYGFSDWKAIFTLFEAQSGKVIQSEKYRLLKDRDVLILTANTLTANIEKQISTAEGNISFADFSLKLEKVTEIDSDNMKNVAFIDKKMLKFPLNVRTWQKGDYFYPLGMRGKKKLSKFFKDEKLSLFEKEKIKVLLSENKIVWVLGKRLDNRFKVGTNTKEILKITIKS